MSMYDEGIAFKGNVNRIKNFLNKCENGENVTIGFIGGSITQGSVATEPGLCYAGRTYDWLTKKYPKANIKFINAGIGGTSSHYGVARVPSDLLQFDPDFVVTEFSVNDENTLFYRETYEGLVRRIYKHQSKPAMIILHNIFYNNGTNAQDQHETVGRYYDIPCLSVKTSIYQAVAHGTIPARDITPDDLHPNNKGHQMVANLITNFLEKVASGEIEPLSSANGHDCDNCPNPCKPIMPNAFTANAYEQAERVLAPTSKTYASEITSLDKLPQVASDNVSKPYGIVPAFTGFVKGDKAVFEFDGTECAAQYIRYVKKPACIAKAVIDDDESTTVILDGNFDETWGDKLDIAILMYHGKPGHHKVTLTVTEGEPDFVPFNLVSLIVSR